MRNGSREKGIYLLYLREGNRGIYPNNRGVMEKGHGAVIMGGVQEVWALEQLAGRRGEK